MAERKLGQLEPGRIFIWRNTSFGETIAIVIEKFDEHTLIRADNGLTYEWPNELQVEVDE